MSRKKVTGSADVVVSMTSYGRRLGIVAHALESIAAGSVRPARMILWVNEPDFEVAKYPMLQRLQRRGLEILRCEDFGPHKKYFPYCREFARDDMNLALADDDLMYPRRWLEILLSASGAVQEIPAYRAHRMRTDVAHSTLENYNSWTPAPTGSTSHANFLTGGAGVLLPPRLQSAIREAGTSFREVAPRADDIWLNALAIRHGYRRRVVAAQGQHLTMYPRSQREALHSENVEGGRNDLQIAAVFGPRDIAVISSDITNTP
ncbi:hypothetical protein [Paenarthrobacter aurescens]|uniref:hypothetical protein n=1 Tax=Paenarthrobacter aurescens TaxID=43663 RepID=UPI0011448234|nr:hypothetical protein [Paenarthrobacter aurescens]MDO6145571.1 hypothetical protein [Paenarthrobacter aurescens]MDO6149380.1 hypothetical protein [Paenarthrobacter aurescens]MDO6160620.1 hypothetical protein [Paenarthrobacter aurescens]MDO6164479.1 hypothetical protein [Paenarthrobacter aurescens]